MEKNKKKSTNGRPPKEGGPTRSRTVSISDTKAEKVENKYGSLTAAINKVADEIPDEA